MITLYHLAIHHLRILAGALAIMLTLSLIFRARVARMMRLAKAAATDKRLPRPVRWLFMVGIAAKAMPVDAGIDELCLGLGTLLLATRYRTVWREIKADIK